MLVSFGMVFVAGLLYTTHLLHVRSGTATSWGTTTLALARQVLPTAMAVVALMYLALAFRTTDARKMALATVQARTSHTEIQRMRQQYPHFFVATNLPSPTATMDRG